MYLTRQDPSKNINRFYSVHLQPDLFGPVCVVKEWGRLGAAGTVRRDLYVDEPTAGAAMALRIGRKAKRGYRARTPSGGGP